MDAIVHAQIKKLLDKKPHFVYNVDRVIKLTIEIYFDLLWLRCCTFVWAMPPKALGCLGKLACLPLRKGVNLRYIFYAFFASFLGCFFIAL